MELIKTIRNFFEREGLDKNLIDIYLFLLTYGAQPISVIAVSLNKKRSSCYDYVKKLAAKGFVSEENRGRMKFVSPVHLDVVLGRINENIQLDFKNKVSQIKHIRKVQHLIGKGSRCIQPRVRVFTGENALRLIYEESLNNQEMIRCYYQPHEGIHSIDDNWHTQQRIAKQINIKVIVPESNQSKDYYSTDKSYTEIRVISEELFPFHGVTLITDNKILMFSAKDNIGFAIECSYLAENQMKIFDLIWNLTENKYG